MNCPECDVEMVTHCERCDWLWCRTVGCPVQFYSEEYERFTYSGKFKQS